MSPIFRFLLIPTVLVPVVTLAACQETVTTVVGRGSVEVTTVTVGVDIDPDGYVVRITGGTTDEMRDIGTSATITVTALDVGMYVLSLEDVAANCTVADNNRPIEVRAGATRIEDFNISCGVAGSPPGSLTP